MGPGIETAAVWKQRGVVQPGGGRSYQPLRNSGDYWFGPKISIHLVWMMQSHEKQGTETLVDEKKPAVNA
jgi:hypothetical protein